MELEGCSAILYKIKMIPMIFTSILFRCLSFVAMATFLRIYSIFPVVLIWFVTHNTLQKVIFQKSFFFNLCKGGIAIINNIPGEIISLTVGPILLPGRKFYYHKKDVTKEDKTGVDLRRRRWFFFDSIGSLILHGLTLITIMILWETTSLLQDNLSVCAFDLIKHNVTLFLGCILGLGVSNCIMTFLYFKY